MRVSSHWAPPLSVRGWADSVWEMQSHLAAVMGALGGLHSHVAPWALSLHSTPSLTHACLHPANIYLAPAGMCVCSPSAAAPPIPVKWESR